MATTGARVGERLRAIRRQKGLSLHDVEARSTLEFKASVLGAYERGERAISVPRLLRLAEIMGTLAYLRDLCGDNDGAEWRKRMAALLSVEGRTERRKAELAGAFNHGFRGYELTYHSCTAAANVVIDRYLDEGGRLAREITSRYGG